VSRCIGTGTGSLRAVHRDCYAISMTILLHLHVVCSICWC